MQKWKLLSAAVLFAGVVVFTIAGSSAPRQETHPQSRPAKKSDASSLPEKEQADPRAEITRENNFGVALMNRQQFEKALGKFQRACIIDPDTDTGCVNVGIAFLNMRGCGSILDCSKRPEATRRRRSKIFKKWRR
jgi:hypothetical protein